MTRQEQFSLSRPVTVEVRIASGEVHVSTAEIDVARVTLSGPDSLVSAMTVALSAQTLTIRQNKERGLLSLLNGGDLRGFLDGSVAIDVLVPDGSSFDMVSASADADLNGEFIDVNARTASGHLRVNGQVYGDVNAKNASGAIAIAHAGGDVTVQTVSGDLRVGAADASVSVTSVSGAVELGSLCGGEVRIQTVSGDVDLGVAQGCAVEVDASSASGEMRSDVPLGDTPVRAAGDGGSVTIRARTVSGNVHITRAPGRAALRV